MQKSFSSSKNFYQQWNLGELNKGMQKEEEVDFVEKIEIEEEEDEDELAPEELQELEDHLCEMVTPKNVLLFGGRNRRVKKIKFWEIRWQILGNPRISCSDIRSENFRRS
ncbi:unnamed protein product [Meloidogyne enterolobii]|uniref:Uncharacterized protein n=1 Tax=Meloidogyne enterolobii TaxID=390850 RepID=A0ACB1ATB3_MELEN